MSGFNLTEHPHRRYNPLTGEWILVSPHRNKRPWQGKVEKTEETQRATYDAACYLCPGNQRAGGAKNPTYRDTFVFTNDFGALQQEVPLGTFEQADLLKAKSERGICRVICFSARHDLTLPEMEHPAIRKVVDLWADQYEELGKIDFINHVQIFENKGAIMGCSNPHPHGQIWAQSTLPVEVQKELQHQKAYFNQYGRSLLSDYVQLELQTKDRIVAENKHFVVVVPFWALWPFETLVISKRHLTDILQFTDEEREAFADIIKKNTTAYDNLFEVSFPYSAGIHQRPTDGAEHPYWHFHVHFYPPLLRSASVKKFMVGYEMLAEPQRDISAEGAAQRLRDLPLEHYKLM